MEGPAWTVGVPPVSAAQFLRKGRSGVGCALHLPAQPPPLRLGLSSPLPHSPGTGGPGTHRGAQGLPQGSLSRVFRPLEAGEPASWLLRLVGPVDARVTGRGCSAAGVPSVVACWPWLSTELRARTAERARTGRHWCLLHLIAHRPHLSHTSAHPVGLWNLSAALLIFPQCWLVLLLCYQL